MPEQITDSSAPPELTEQEIANNQRAAMRAQINQMTGADNTSILGTTADATALVLCTFAEFTTALANAITVADVKAAAEPLKDLFAPMLADVAAGDTIFTCDYKGREEVLAEAAQRSTAVSNILAAAEPAE